MILDGDFAQPPPIGDIGLSNLREIVVAVGGESERVEPGGFQ